ncbi:thioredoxin [Candidatus Velamenicoccus archaeovorus]|uniref:Thioredoxin n=1 Tax=Velamenicoccus archaeovorus TaxID=1930593 RepID=A0A410P2F6_VELA1|nr:thioredoxin domain-containing protein [Candidatus Velamenicoccus archaeovorus]QAT16323.1 thioredoxin [Candidatus Velamenicoccus archaeovorus]
MVKLIEINDTQFNALVLKASLPVLVECASPECIICKAMAQRVREAARDYLDQMLFFRLNVNESRRWKDYGVRVIPTLLYFKGGELAARQETFPEIEEIQGQIRVVLGQDAGTGGPVAELKNAMDLEHAAAQFYKYVAANVRNGRAKERFRQLQHQSIAHHEILGRKYKELSGESYQPAEKIVDPGLKPYGFSLLGAMKMAIRLEEKLLAYYKKLAKSRIKPAEKELFKKIIKEEGLHLKAVRQEKAYAQRRELESSLEVPEQSSWLNKVFE